MVLSVKNKKIKIIIYIDIIHLNKGIVNGIAMYKAKNFILFSFWVSANVPVYFVCFVTPIYSRFGVSASIGREMNVHRSAIHYPRFGVSASPLVVLHDSPIT